MRLIDADKLPKYTGYALSADEVAMAVEKAPTVDPMKHGRWINAYPEIEPNPMFMYGICSECDFEQSISDKLNYCPNCGAKMDEVSE